jgi:phage-related protein (TIGR01555 family)
MADPIRVVNVRPKPGFVMDASGAVMPGNVVRLPVSDGLTNALSGVGTGRDVRAASAYTTRPMTQYEIAAAYSGSGLMRKIIRIPALDMVREWRDPTGLDADQAAKLFEHEKRHGLRQKIQQAEVLRGMGGAAIILGLPGDPAQPAPPTVSLNGLSYINVVSRWHLSFNGLQDDARMPGYGEPIMWRLSTTGGQKDIHPSRVIPFRADTTAAMAMPATWGDEGAFWGESTVQQVLEAVQDSDTARASFAALMHKARLLRIGIPKLMQTTATPGGDTLIQKRLAAVVMAESIHNATIFDAGDPETGKGGETITDATYTFAGVKDVLAAYAEFVAAISDIPATRLLGRAPEGMNASGDSQQADWRKKVRAMQTLDLGPCLDRLDRYLVPSAIGSVPPQFAYDFAPLDTPDQTAVAARFKTQMEAVEKLANLNVMPEQALSRGVQSLMIEEGYLPELEAALAAYPDDERYGLEQGDDGEGGDPDDLAGEGGLGLEAEPPRRAANDAAPRTLYVSRPVVNRADLQRWATEQGIGELQPDLHVTIAYSQQPVDWMKIEGEWNQDDNGQIEIAPGGVRIVEPLGDRTAVLLFTASRLAWRHEQILRSGATWGYPDYQPHISLTGGPVDLSAVEPYQGKIVLGPERFEEIREAR